MLPNAHPFATVTLLCIMTSLWRGVAGAGLPGYGSYCNDGSVETRFGSEEWAEPPYCMADDSQNAGEPLADFTNKYTTVYLANYSKSLFCCSSNYTTVIPRTTTVEAMDDQARRYHEAASKILARFNCRDFYPYFNCTPCQMAYRSWVCSVVFPRKCRDDSENDVFGRLQKTCADVCHEVVRKCPVELEFHCPTDSSYTNWGSDTDWDTSSYGVFRGRCNPMQLNLNSGHSLRGVLSRSLLWVVFALVVLNLGG
eukprot:TRINITY_DN13822_c0_g1_i1.p1 TRINITY_DN13822_c0_g1~~TRINITY_DN13822_c0_g1_i1.p1  ORF type:complete len:254 (+),score=30.73 TRINITY_DN13822_c0_g1_i1:69-830(+)